MSSAGAHDQSIVAQFTKQAVPFAEKHSSRNEALDLLVNISGLSSSDTVLDVACGPGLVACAMARHAAHVTGIDVTPAMIEQAERLQRQSGLSNVTWRVGNALPLPYDRASFSMLVTRYSLHHFLQPDAVIEEMVRVCKQGGKIVVVDSTPEPAKADAFNKMEKLRDPTHTRAMPLTEILGLLKAAAVEIETVHPYWWEVELEKQLLASFPDPGNESLVRDIVRADVDSDHLGMRVALRDGSVYMSYPTTIVVCRK